jgi:hypothetical protein
MERRTVLISGELLATFLRQGNITRAVRVEKGLPHDAVLVGFGMTTGAQVALIFSGDWPSDAPEPFTPEFTTVGWAEAQMREELDAAKIGVIARGLAR